MAGGFGIGRPGQFDSFRRECIQQMERASLKATDRAARAALMQIRSAMQSAGLGRLGNALTAGSDLQKGARVHHLPGGGFRVSGWISVRTKSERAIGTLESYLEGAEITPKRSLWMWISTDEIPRFAGRKRMTPQLYITSGLDHRIGPLIQVPGRSSNESLLIVPHVTVDKFGRAGKARRVPKRGAVGASRRKVDHIVAFVGIKRTSRAARISPRHFISIEQARLPEYRAAAMNS